MCWVVGIQTLDLLVGSAVACELAVDSLGKSSMDGRNFVEDQVFSEEAPAQHRRGKKSTSLDALERVRGRVWLHLCYASPKRGTAQCQARTSWPVISLPRGQWVHGTVPMWSFPSPVACCHRGLIPSTVYRVLSPELQEEKEEGVQESGWSESQKTLKGCRSC